MEPPPDRIMQIAWGHLAQRTLTAAVDLNLFGHLASGARTAAEAAHASGASERGVRMVLDALTAMGLLAKDNDGYQLTPETETFLVPGSQAYLGGLVQHVDLLWETTGRLTEAVRTGLPQCAVDLRDDGESFFAQLVPLIFGMSYGSAQQAAAGLGVGDTWCGLTVLDVGAGAGPWSLAMLQRDRSARAIAVDWPHVLEVTRRYAADFGCLDRYEFRAGNLREVDYGESCCDLAILGHICHSEGAQHSRELFAKLKRALRPGGKLLVADMVPDEARREAAFPLLFALNMLLHTTEGDTFTLGEYTAWLEGAGFARVETLANTGPSPLIVATR